MMTWQGVGKKQEIAKRIVLHPYPQPITDPTQVLEVKMFLFRVSQNMSSLSASFDQYVCYSLV